MEISNFYQLNTEEYNISHLYAMQQKWDNRKIFINQNRKTSALLYLHDSSIHYRLAGGELLIAPRGSVVFLPQGCSYQCTFFTASGERALSQLVEFALKDRSGESFSVYDRVTVVGSDENPLVPELFAEAVAAYNRPVFSPPLLKAAVYQLIACIAGQNRQQTIASAQLAGIQPAVAWLERNHLPEEGIPQLARMCHMSEVSFRKKFRAYAGMTPSEYILKQKMQRAKRLLRSGLASVAQAAEAAGFDDPSYFSKVFKKYTGILPGEYMRRY